MNLGYACGTETGQKKKGEARPQSPCQSQTKIKVKLAVFFYCHDIVHYEFLSLSQKFNKNYCLSTLHCLYEAIC